MACPSWSELTFAPGPTGRRAGRSISGDRCRLAHAAFLEAGAQRGRIEVATDEDDLVHALLLWLPGAPGAAVQRHVDSVEHEPSALPGDVENPLEAQEVAALRKHERIEPAVE